MGSTKIAIILGLIIGLSLLVAIAAVLVLPGVTPAPAGPPGARTVRISGTEFEFFRGQVVDPVLRLQVGETIRLVFDNAGISGHAVAVVEADEESASLTLASTPVFPDAISPLVEPGRSWTIIFVADRAGEYQFVCPIPGHASLGMVTTLLVEDENPVAGASESL